jgi:hypothetical protein
MKPESLEQIEVKIAFLEHTTAELSTWCFVSIRRYRRCARKWPHSPLVPREP